MVRHIIWMSDNKVFMVEYEARDGRGSWWNQGHLEGLASESPFSDGHWLETGNSGQNYLKAKL